MDYFGIFQIEEDDTCIYYDYREKLNDGRTLDFRIRKLHDTTTNTSIYDVCLTIVRKRKRTLEVFNNVEVTGVGMEGLLTAKTILEMFEEMLRGKGDENVRHFIRIRWSDQKRKRAYKRLVKDGYRKNREQEFFEKEIILY